MFVCAGPHYLLVCTCPAVGLYLLGFEHTPSLCACAHLCSFVLVSTTGLSGLIWACPAVGLYPLGVAHTPALCTCAHPCSFVLVPAICLFGLVLPLVGTRSVLHVHLPFAHVLTCVRANPRYLLVRTRLGPFVHMFVPVCTCPAVRLYSLGCAGCRLFVCLFVLVHAHLGTFVCIKYTVSIHIIFRKLTFVICIISLDKNILLVFEVGWEWE